MHCEAEFLNMLDPYLRFFPAVFDEIWAICSCVCALHGVVGVKVSSDKGVGLRFVCVEERVIFVPRWGVNADYFEGATRVVDCYH